MLVTRREHPSAGSLDNSLTHTHCRCLNGVFTSCFVVDVHLANIGVQIKFTW
jgi:hypothetical protein